MPALTFSAEHDPEQPELPRPPCHVHRNELRADGGSLRRCLGRRPPAGRPSGGRQAVAERADHHRAEVDHAHHDERLPHADRRGRGELSHQQIGQRRADHRAAAETHDRQSCRHPASIGKPLDEGGHGRDVSEAQAASADDPRAEPEHPELMQIDARGGHEEPAAPAAGGNHAGLPRSLALDPCAEDRGRRAEHHEEERVHPAERAELPVVRRRQP